jgi:hypothetical protein
MSKVKIKIISIGHLPIRLNLEKIKSHLSAAYEIVGDIENHVLRCNSDGYDWEFSDELVRAQLPLVFDADFMIVLVNVPLEANWYVRRVGNNQVVLTFHEIKEILINENIPLENVIYRLLYAYTLLFRRSSNRIPNFGEPTRFTHDETRGCLFDMNGIKANLVESCDSPIICDQCEEALIKEKVSNDLIKITKSEIKQIKKEFYYKVIDFIKRYPIWALLISSLFAVLLNVVASWIYDLLKKHLGF